MSGDARHHSRSQNNLKEKVVCSSPQITATGRDVAVSWYLVQNPAGLLESGATGGPATSGARLLVHLTLRLVALTEQRIGAAWRQQQIHIQHSTLVGCDGSCVG